MTGTALKWLGGLLAGVVVVSVVGLPLYVNPRSDPLKRSDVILVLGSGTLERYELGVQLYKDGYAPNLLFSIPDVPTQLAGCDFPIDGVSATCFTPEPADTRGEASELARRSAANGWTSAIVVTVTPHVSRARWTLRRCNPDVAVIEAPIHVGLKQWVLHYAYQSAAWVKAAVEDPCSARS